MIEKETKEKLKDVMNLPFAKWEERGIRSEVFEKFCVRMAVSEKDGRTPTAYYFPYYDQRGKLSGYKKRNLLLDKSERGHFTAIGRVGVDCKMFGQDVAEGIKRKHSNIILVEGELDLLSVYQSVVDSVKGSQYEGMEPFVVSVSCGTANAVENVLHNEAFVKSFNNIIFGFDNDSCTPKEKMDKMVRGKECTENVASALLADNMFVLEYSSEYKDPNDYIVAGKSKELADLVKFSKTPFVAEKIVSAASVTFEELCQKREEGVYVDDFPKLMEKIHGFRTRELVVVTAPSNVGKSTVVAKFATAFLKAGQPTGMIMLEETNKETVLRLVADHLKINYNLLKDNPLAYTTQEKLQEAYDYVVKEHDLYLLQHFGSMPINDLMNKIKNMVLVNGVRYIILDHLSMVISGLAVTDERKELDIVMTELAAFCASNDVCVIAVSHINRSGADQFKPPKGKEDEPFWVNVTKEMMRGCVDSDTEFLTSNGWKKISDYVDGDDVFQIDSALQGSFKNPLAYVKKPCNEFLHFKTQKGVDMMLSEEHRIAYFTERRKNEVSFITAKDAKEVHDAQTTGFRGKIPTTFSYNGAGMDISEDNLRLQIAVNADGWIKNDGTGLCSIRVKKERKIKRLIELLERTGTKYHRFDLSGDRVEFSFISPLKKKGIDFSWYVLNKEQLCIFEDEVKYWDGDVRTGRFSTVDKFEADFVQFVYSSVGYRSTVSVIEENESLLPKNDGTGESRVYKTKKLYIVSKAKNKTVSFRKTPESSPEISVVKSLDGFKYCFTTETGMFLARRNGKIFVTGNSASLEQLSWIVLGLEPEIMPDRSRGRARLTVLKNRPWAYLGHADEFRMDDETGEIQIAESIAF